MASQDMPPPGGFAEIKVGRTFPKPMIRQGLWGAILVGLTLNGGYAIKEWRKKYRILKLEQVEHYIAAQPFLLAEQERNFLIHLNHLREEERELMKDHPGWILGTLYGEPVFKTLPDGVLPSVPVGEFIVHRPFSEYMNRAHIPDQHR